MNYLIEENRKYVRAKVSAEEFEMLKEYTRLYDEHFSGRTYAIVYDTGNEHKLIEISFGKDNFMHLTGLRIKGKFANTYIKDVLNHTSDNIPNFETSSNHPDFYKMKLEALADLLTLPQSFVSVGENIKKQFANISAKKVSGNIRTTLFLDRTIKNEVFFPKSLFKLNIDDISTNNYPIIAVFSKSSGKYSNKKNLRNSNTFDYYRLSDSDQKKFQEYIVIKSEVVVSTWDEI